MGIEGLIFSEGEKPFRKNILFCNKAYDEISVPNSKVAEYSQLGYRIRRPGKARTRMIKQKHHGRLWNHNVWSIFAKMGFEELNEITRDSQKFVLPGIHEIDVFAKAGETVILVECKSKVKPGKKTIRSHLLEINGYREKATKFIKKHYGNRIKVAFGLATENYAIPDADINLAKESNITLIDESTVDYYHQIIKGTGRVSKYQLLSDFFPRVEFEDLKVSVPALKTSIGGHDAFMFTIKPEKLIPISFIAHRAKGEAADVSSFQRLVKGRRLKEIREYIEGEAKGFFPTNVLLNIDSEGKGARYQSFYQPGDGQEFVNLMLPGRYKSAWVIDGQHRLLAYEESNLKNIQNLCVIAFFDLDPSLQANMFVDINNKQKRVPANVIIELNAKLKWGSEKPKEFLQAMNARTMLTLATKRTSPLYGLVKLEGDSDKSKPFTGKTIEEVIRTQRYFGTDKSGALQQSRFWVPQPVLERSKEKSMNKLYNFLSLVLLEFDKSCITWNKDLTNEEGRFVLTNNGISAIIQTLSPLISEAEKNLNMNSQDNSAHEIFDWINPWIRTLIQHFNGCGNEKLKSYREKQGKAGQSQNKTIFLGIISKNHPDFRPVGLESALKEISEQWTEDATKLVKKMEERISSFWIAYLKEQYPEKDDWLMEGVKQSIVKEVFEKKLQNRATYEESFDLKHWKQICESPQYWTDTKHVFGIQKEKGQSGKAKLLSWYDHLIKVRNKTAHNRLVTEPEYHELNKYWSVLEPKLLKAEEEDI